MLNVMTWIRGRGDEGRGSHYKQVDDASHKVTLNYIRAQVDNALCLGWSASDIRLYTNFAFEHMGVKAIRHHLIYTHNSFHNKWTAVKQCASDFKVCPDLYFHDVDAFQAEWIDFPTDRFGSSITGIGFATSHNNRFRWNAGVAFLKGEAVNGMLRGYFRKASDRKKVFSDEHVWNDLYNTGRSKPYFHELARRYNLAEGSHWFDEWLEVGGDLKILHIKPHQLFRPWHWFQDTDGSQRTMSCKVTPPRLKELFQKYQLWHPDNDKRLSSVPLIVQEGNSALADE